MSLLHRLYNNVSALILSQWLVLKDITVLDSALCTSLERIAHKQTVSKLLTYWVVPSVGALIWLFDQWPELMVDSNGLAAENEKLLFELIDPQSCYFRNPHVAAMCDHVLDKLQTLRVSFITSGSQEWRGRHMFSWFFQSTGRSLMHIDIGNCHNMCDDMINEISVNCVGLRSLSLGCVKYMKLSCGIKLFNDQGEFCSVAGLSGIFSRCKELQKLHLINFANKHMGALISQMGNLTDLKVKNSSWIHQEGAVIAIASVCTRLKRLQITHTPTCQFVNVMQLCAADNEDHLQRHLKELEEKGSAIYLMDDDE